MNGENNKDRHLLISYLTLRKAIGWLGILLPVVLLIGNFLISGVTGYEDDCDPYKNSISHYYYTRLGEVFTGTLCAVALFLFTYNGHPKQPGEKGLSDRTLSMLAAIFALGVVFFPTSAEQPIPCNLRNYVSSSLTGGIHLTSAALFFLTLAVMSYFNFTKTSGAITPQKLKRNRIYKICAIAIIVSLLGCAIYIFGLKNKVPSLDIIHPVFCFEAIALFAFGFSWLTKGEFLLKD